jgi:arylformamidase
MSRHIYDISQSLSERIPVWPGDPPVEVVSLRDATPEQEASADPPSFVSRLSLSTHAGTHVDPPAHFLPGAATVDAMSLDTLIGPAWVAAVEGPGPITAEQLEAAGIPAGTTRLLLRTENSERSHAEFDRAFVAIDVDAARWLLAHGVRLVGIDGPSIEPFGSPGHRVHRTLLPAGVILLEGIRLAAIAPGPYELVCLPLSIERGDGAPARAVLIRTVEA